MPLQETIFQLIQKIEGGEIDQLELLLYKLGYEMGLPGDVVDEDDYSDPPQISYQGLRKQIEKQFPCFGYYNIPESVTDQIMNCGLMVGDAIDDLADILKELYDARWRFENTSESDALWHLKTGYQGHWREHLVDLLFYLNYFESEKG